MAIAIDNVTTAATVGTSPLTWTHTVSNGTSILLVVGIVAKSEVGTQATTTAVTYGGVSMTKARADQNTTNNEESSIWMLFNPTRGANLISATLTLGAAGQRAGGVSVSYKNAQQSSTADAVNGSTGSGVGDKTVAVTTVANNCWIFAIGVNSCTVSPSITSDQNPRGNSTSLTVSGNGYLMQCEDTYILGAAGAKTVGFTMAAGTGTAQWCFTAASFAPVDDTVGFGAPINKIRPRPFAPGMAR